MKHPIMIVDDNEQIRDAVELMFQAFDCDVVTAEDGLTCLEKLADGFRGIILMDVMMPGLDGWDTIRELVARGYYEGNLIVMLTAKEEPDQKMEGLQAYVTDYITKPFVPSELLEVVTYLDSLMNG